MVQGFSADVMHDKEPVAPLRLEGGSSALKPTASPPKLTRPAWQRVFLTQTHFGSIHPRNRQVWRQNTAVSEMRGAVDRNRHLHLPSH